jgi:2-methylcitrate dehydratase PrpD
MEYLSDASWTKRLHPGLAAVNGLRAARLARAGYTGPTTALEGRLGFLHAYGGTESVARSNMSFTPGAGVTGTSIKLYACCRYLHGVIDLLSEINGWTGLKPDEIASIDCGVLEAGIALIAEPRDVKVAVRGDVDAQFSLPFAAALSVSTGRATLDDFAAATTLAPEMSGLMERVSYHTEPELEAAYPGRWGASVRVRAKNGAEIHRRTTGFRGSPSLPASWDDVTQKAAGLVGSDLASEMAAACHDLEGDEPIAAALAFRRRASRAIAGA